MKRTGFKQKPRKPRKRTPLRRVSLNKKPAKKQKIGVLKKKLWKLFSLFIRERDKYICFTCGRHATGSGMHAGHFVPKSIGGITLYFNEDNVHAQCYNCNINLSGNQWEYGQRLGKEKVAEIMELKKVTAKWGEQDYLDKIEYYD